MSTKRKYSPEFKQGAVEQASQSSVTAAQVARKIGINTNVLSRCKRESTDDGTRC